MTYNILDVANEIAKYGSEQEYMSLRKLQFMLYFHQGFYLSSFGEPIFYDIIIARDEGPEIDLINTHYKDMKYIEPNYNKFLYFKNIMDYKLFHEVNYQLGQYTTWRLCELTKETDPYKNAIENNKKIISKEEMEEYFKKSKLII